MQPDLKFISSSTMCEIKCPIGALPVVQLKARDIINWLSLSFLTRKLRSWTSAFLHRALYIFLFCRNLGCILSGSL